MGKGIVKLGQGQWAVKDGNLLAAKDTNGRLKNAEFTVSRGTDATYVNRNGLIVNETGDNTPRIDFTDNTDGHLLLEPQSTNYTEYGNDASQWSNLVSNGTVTKTVNYAVSPDGTQNATRLEASVSGSGYALISLAITTAFIGNYTSTVYVKSNTGSSQNISFYGRNTDVATHTVTDEWTRIQFKGSSTSGQSNYAYIGISTPISAEDNPIDILVWGGQLEALPYATSYIPTNGSTVTRDAETCTGAGEAADFNTEEGVLYAEVASLAEVNQGVAISNGTYDSRILFYFDTSGNIRGYIFASGNQFQQTTSGVDYKSLTKMAIKYSATSTKFYVNGNLIGTEDTSSTMPSDLNQLSLHDGGGGNKFYGRVKAIRVYKETDGIDLGTLTSL